MPRSDPRSTTDPDALREAIEEVREIAISCSLPDGGLYEAIHTVCDAAARAAEAERERDEYRALWKSRSDIRAYDKVCAERDEARAHIDRLERILTNERLAFPRYFVGSVKDRDAVAADALRATLTDIERLLRAGWALENIGDTFWFSSPAFSPTRRAPTLPAAVRAAVEELEEKR